MSKKNRHRAKALRLLPVQQQARILSNLLLEKAALENPYIPPEKEPFCLLINDYSLLKMSAFIACCTKGDMSALILSGEPNDRQLQQAYMQILSDFYQTKKDVAILNYIKLSVSIINLEVRMNRVQRNIDALRMHYHPALIEELKADGYTSFRFTEQTIEKDLQRIETSEKKYKLYHQRYSKQYDDLYGKKEGEADKGLVKEDHFIEDLDVLRKFGGYNMTPMEMADRLTVKEFCMLNDKYTEYVEYQKQQNLPKAHVR